MTKVLAEISGLRSDTYVKNTRETKIMKNDSTSDQVINTTVTDICDELKNLSAGKHTIKINGKINNETLNAINETLQDLNNLDIMISLDLSDTTGLTSIENKAFGYCKSLTSVTIPNSVTSIGDYAFGYCDSLTSVIIPNSVTEIGTGAFCGCESLTSVTIPDSVIEIGNRAFCGCKSLTNVIIPNSVTSIGDKAFSYCKSLTSVIIPDSVASIGDKAFVKCTKLKITKSQK